jgi:hypothetical protein
MEQCLLLTVILKYIYIKEVKSLKEYTKKRIIESEKVLITLDSYKEVSHTNIAQSFWFLYITTRNDSSAFTDRTHTPIFPSNVFGKLCGTVHKPTC